MDRSGLKNVFWSNLCVSAAFQILNILQYACGSKRDPALTLNQNTIFETASIENSPASASCRRQRTLVSVMVLLLTGLGLVLWGCNEKPPMDTAEAPLPATAYAGTIVAVGDSLTAGLGVSEARAYPAQLARRLQADGRNYRVVNAGVSGETSSGALSRIEWVVSSLAPDIVILETGANDGLRGLDPELLKTNLDRLAGMLKTNDIQVVLAGMQMLPNLGPDYTRAFSDIYPAIAQKHDLILIPFFLEGVAGNDPLNQPDNLHPTADGYTRIVETLYPYVIEAIDRHEAG